MLLYNNPESGFVEGEDHVYSTVDSEFIAHEYGTAAVEIVTIPVDSDGSWHTWFEAPFSEELVVGEYVLVDDLLGPRFDIDLYSDQPGRSDNCRPASGTFEVLEIVWSEGEVLSFHATFSVTCRAGTQPVQGSVSYGIPVDPRGALAGVVEGDPDVAEGEVRLFLAGQSTPASSATPASDGSFEFPDIAAAAYDVEYVSPGAPAQWHGGHVVRQLGEPVVVLPDREADIGLEPTLGAAMWGTVTGESASGFPLMTVSVFDEEARLVETRDASTPAETTYYEFFLEPGGYRVVGEPDAYIDWSSAWHPAATSFSAATAIELTRGDVSRADIYLPGVAQFELTANFDIRHGNAHVELWSDRFTHLTEWHGTRYVSAGPHRLLIYYTDFDNEYLTGVFPQWYPNAPYFRPDLAEPIPLEPGVTTAIEMTLTAFFPDMFDSPYIQDIAWLQMAGVTNGCGGGNYCPDAFVTRGQMAAFLVRALQLTATGDIAFEDDEGSTFEREIEILAHAGITRGCGRPEDHTFCPDDLVTRGQMAAFLVRALGYDHSGTVDFVDDDNSVFEDDIEKLATAGVTRGCASDRFCPDDYVSREHMAVFLHRALGGVLYPVELQSGTSRFLAALETSPWRFGEGRFVGRDAP